MTTRQAIPLYRLEAARSHLAGLFDRAEPCCLVEADLVDEVCNLHDPDTTDPRMDPEYLTLRDLLDDLIEEART